MSRDDLKAINRIDGWSTIPNVHRSLDVTKLLPLFCSFARLNCMSMGVRMRILRWPSSLMLLGLAIALMAGCKPVPISQKPVEAPPAQIHFPPIKPPPPQTPASIDELKKSAAKVLSKYHIPGVGIALVSKDKVLWAGGVGKADLASGKDVDADTMFRIGSITKGFVALSILQLQAQGKVSLDSKLAEVAPEVPVLNPWEKTDPITVANLLEHTASFDDFSHQLVGEVQRQYQYFRSGKCFLDAARSFQTVQVRHADVHDNDFGF